MIIKNCVCRKLTFTSSLFILSNTLFLSSCDDKLERENHKEVSSVEVLAEKIASKAKVPERKKTLNIGSSLSPQRKVKRNKLSNIAVKSLPENRESTKALLWTAFPESFTKEHKGLPQLLIKPDSLLFSMDSILGQTAGAMVSLERMVIDEKRHAVRMDLDLTLSLGIIEKNNSLRRNRDELLPGLFQPEEGISSIQIEAHFEGPHIENKERDATPDGVGVGIEIGI